MYNARTLRDVVGAAGAGAHTQQQHHATSEGRSGDTRPTTKQYNKEFESEQAAARRRQPAAAALHNIFL